MCIQPGSVSSCEKLAPWPTDRQKSYSSLYVAMAAQKLFYTLYVYVYMCTYRHMYISVYIYIYVLCIYIYMGTSTNT